MTWLDETFYPTGPTTGSYVYVGGKPPEVAAADFRGGLARMGGFWRYPSYFESYLTAASLLIAQGAQRRDYDDIGLPAFYLQRHATELLLKRLLEWFIDIIVLKSKLTPSAGHRVPSRCCYALRKSHDLSVLLKAMERVAERAGEALPPDNLTNLVEELTQVEKDDHWSRYGHSYQKDRKNIHHKVETTIPIVRLQNLLEEVADSILARRMGDETYENELHSVWSGLNRLLEEH